MESVRGLLSLGNSKLGQAISHFDLPAIAACPGRTVLCSSLCYATTGNYRFPQVQERLQWCFEQSLRDDFAQRMIAEIKRKGALVIRLHCSGDVYSAEYGRKWLEVMKACPRSRYYLYSRSYRVPDIAKVLEEMSALRCCRVWYSLDRETGLPAKVPPGVRLAYLQVDADEEPELLDLLFVVRRLRRHARRVHLPMLCPHQAGTAENCGHCTRCFR